MDELIELAREAGFDTFSPNSIDDDMVICTYCGSGINENLVKFAGLIASKQAERIAKLEAALIKLRDCDWVVTWADRMDAVRDIAREALED